MSDIANSAESDSREVLQATSVKMQAYAMKIDLLSNATVLEKAVQFVDRHVHNNNDGLGRGLAQQNEEVTIDDTAEPEQNPG